MLTKKELLLKAGLELFATEGYTATSTNKIAARAGVSEGLIFRHFSNKEGLVNAIFEQGEERFRKLYADILSESDPRRVLQKTIDMTFDVGEQDYEFWRLQFRLKWELQHHNPDKYVPLVEKLTTAFRQLNYDQPGHEALFLNQYLEGLASQTLLGKALDKQATRKFLFSKYDLA